MNRLFKNILKQITSFICEQYLVLLLALGIGIKFAFLYDKILHLDWYGDHFSFGISLGFIGALAIFSPLFILRKNKNKFAIILSIIVTLLILIDTVYYSYFSSLPTVGLISSAGQATDIGPAIGNLLRWWFVLYFIDIFILIATRKYTRPLMARIKEKYDIKQPNWKLNLLTVFMVIIFYWISILTPGIAKLNEVLDRGYDTVSTSHYYGVLTAHGIDLARYINEITTKLSNQEKKSLVEWINQNKPRQSISELNGVAKGKNVIIIQVESLGGFVVNQKINNKEITPNLDKLAKESQFFPNDRFLYGAGHTSDSDFVVNTSYFPLNDAATFVRYGRDDFVGLPKILINNKYSAFAYHGFNRNFWNRDAAYRSIGYQKFYAADNYPDGVKINMGLNDDDFLSKTAEYIKKQPKPSLSYAITLTSHVPFNVTGQKNELAINTADYPDQVGGYIENIHYVDRAIGRFFEKLKQNNLYEDSLIIMYGDHTPVLPSFSAGTINYDPDSIQQKEVPLFIKLPNNNVGKTHANQGSHIDIMPTILDLLGIKTNQLMFGRSLFNDSDPARQSCPDQIYAFKKLGDCTDALNVEKSKSSTIIRYNQFNNLPK